jgi:uncharacterized protein (DUF2132 family)
MKMPRRKPPMSNDVNYKNNPLHGLSLKNLLIELVDHYGFELLYAYLQLNCFKSNPSIDSSVNFLKKTDWAREKVEALYLYEFKSLPRASSEQFAISPRDRIISDDQTSGAPRELSFEDAQQLQEKRIKKAFDRDRGRYGANKSYGNKRQSSSRSRISNRDHKSNQGLTESSEAPAKSSNPWSNTKIKPEN